MLRQPGRNGPLVREEDRQPSGNAGDSGRQGSGIDQELITYLTHVAAHPYVPVIQRDQMLFVSKYKGSTTRKRMMEAGWVRSHKVGTGRRSGQLVLLEVTGRGYEFLSSMRIRVERPKGRGGFLHRYYAIKIKEYAEATWPEWTATVEDGTQGRPVDVLVRTADDSGRTIAFEIFMTGEAKEVRGIARDVQLFDQIIVCAVSPGALEALQARAREAMDNEMLSKVTFSLISQYLISGGLPQETAKPPLPSRRTSLSRTPRRKDSKTPEQVREQDLDPKPSLEKSGTKLELEAESRETIPVARRGRKPRAPLMRQVEEAYLHLHDLEWLQGCELSNLPEVQARLSRIQTMSEGRFDNS